MMKSREAQIKKVQLAVLCGGCSEEHSISLKSAHTIISHLDQAKYAVVVVVITKTGEWVKYGGPVDLLLTEGWQAKEFCVPVILAPNRDIGGLVTWQEGARVVTKLDVVFPMLHGKGGEDGSIQGLLELAGLPYVGCGVAGSVLGMDKALAKGQVEKAGIRVAPGLVLELGDTWQSKLAEIEQLSYPLFVKPAGSGSSFGVSKVEAKEGLADAIAEARRFDAKILVEQGIKGCEIGCSVLGNGRDLTVGAVDLIELSQGFFRIHQEEQPEVASENSNILVPAPLKLILTKQIQATAKIIYQALGCKGLARVDLFLTPENQLVFNEVNTMPGFTSYSRYPQMMAAAGLQMEELIDRLIALARAA